MSSCALKKVLDFLDCLYSGRAGEGGAVSEPRSPAPFHNQGAGARRGSARVRMPGAKLAN
jgi:hypothetical protein